MVHHLDVSTAVKIPRQGDGWLGFDLREVMKAVGPHEDLSWHLSEGEIVLRDGASEQSLRLVQAQANNGVGLTWSDMIQLSEECLQVIDGRFVGRREGQPVLSFDAIDSSYWIVWTVEEQVAERVRVAFRGVEEHDEPALLDVSVITAPLPCRREGPLPVLGDQGEKPTSSTLITVAP